MPPSGRSSGSMFALLGHCRRHGGWKDRAGDRVGQGRWQGRAEGRAGQGGAGAWEGWGRAGQAAE